MEWLNYRLIKQTYLYLKSCVMLPCLPKTTFSLIISNKSDKDHLHWKSKLFGIRWRLTFFSTAYLTLAQKIECFLRKWKKKKSCAHTHNLPVQKFQCLLFFQSKFDYFHGVILLSYMYIFSYMFIGVMPVPLDQIRSLKFAISRQPMSVCWLICKEWPFLTCFV